MDTFLAKHDGEVTGTLCEMNLLEEVIGYQRNRFFRFRPYLDLFQAEK